MCVKDKTDSVPINLLCNSVTGWSVILSLLRSKKISGPLTSVARLGMDPSEKLSMSDEGGKEGGLLAS